MPSGHKVNYWQQILKARWKWVLMFFACKTCFRSLTSMSFSKLTSCPIDAYCGQSYFDQCIKQWKCAELAQSMTWTTSTKLLSGCLAKSSKKCPWYFQVFQTRYEGDLELIFIDIYAITRGHGQVDQLGFNVMSQHCILIAVFLAFLHLFGI